MQRIFWVIKGFPIKIFSYGAKINIPNSSHTCVWFSDFSITWHLSIGSLLYSACSENLLWYKAVENHGSEYCVGSNISSAMPIMLAESCEAHLWFYMCSWSEQIYQCDRCGAQWCWRLVASFDIVLRCIFSMPCHVVTYSRTSVNLQFGFPYFLVGLPSWDYCSESDHLQKINFWCYIVLV